MRNNNVKENKKAWVLLIGGLIIIIVCVGMVGWLIYQSMINNKEIPDYAIAFFSSITTLILGYLFGRGGFE
jgi:hypothetical protein